MQHKSTARPYILTFLLITLLFRTTAYSQPEVSATDFKWQVGEELTYKVKYLFLTLGSLRFQILEKVEIDGRPAYHCRLYIDSNPQLPFVSIHDIYESYIDEEVYSHQFYSYERKSDHTVYTAYQMDYEKNRVHIIIEKWSETDTTRLLDSTAVIPEKVQDSLSLLFFARASVKHAAQMDVPVFAFNEFKYAFINFTGEKRKKNGIEGYYLDGRLKFVGIAGIKEDFKGWFSVDPQSVPLFANMKAFIGSVGIDLKGWKNWEAPPLVAERISNSELDD